MQTDKLLKKLIIAVSDENETAEAKKQKLLFVVISYFSAIIGFIITLYLFFSVKNFESGLIVLAYTAVVIINIVLFLLHRDFELHNNFFLIVSLFTPFLVHLFSIYDQNLLPIYWGLLVPFSAILIGSTKKALFWTVDYLALILFTSIIDRYFFHSQSLFTVDYNFFSGQFAFIALIIVSLFVFQYYVQKTAGLNLDRDILQNENNKAQDLLNNLLPEEIALRLKHEKAMIADSFDNVTVLFADMVGFTELSSKLAPKELVDLLNVIFSSFDMIVDDLGLEKIKTMGDAYMAAAGIPNPMENHADAAADAAIRFMEEVRKFSELAGIDIKVRIGLHSGPVVAGVIGIKKTVYDLWGDTVNVAARMEHHGLPDRIQITRATHQLLKGRYSFISRGLIQVKGKGPMETFILIDKIHNPKKNIEYRMENLELMRS